MAGELDKTGEKPVKSSGPVARIVGAGVLGVGLAAFVFQNTGEVEVTWLFFDASQPLWVVLLVTVAIALVLGEMIGAALRRRKRHQR